MRFSAQIIRMGFSMTVLKRHTNQMSQ